MKIGLFTDTHYCDLDLLEQDRKPRYAYAAVKRAFEDFKAQDVQIAVCLGDLVHFHNGIEESIRHLKQISSLINSYGIPTYQCMGNHDNEVVSAEDMAKITGFHVAPTTVEDNEVRLVFLVLPTGSLTAVKISTGRRAIFLRPSLLGLTNSSTRIKEKSYLLIKI